MPTQLIDRDLGWRDLFARVQTLRGQQYVRVGVIGERGEQKEGDLTVAEYAAVNEFGTEDGRIPARSFLRSTFDAKRAEIEELKAKLIAKMLFTAEMTAEKALNILGMKLATDVRNAITDGEGIPPPNAPSVQARKEAKGNNGRWGVRTLVDSGRMLGAIGWAIAINGQEQETSYVSSK